MRHFSKLLLCVFFLFLFSRSYSQETQPAAFYEDLKDAYVLLDCDSLTEIEFSYSTLIPDRFQRFERTIKGEYLQAVPIDRPLLINIDVDDELYTAFLTAQDTVRIHFDKDSVFFSGSNKAFNDYLFERRNFFGELDYAGVFMHFLQSGEIKNYNDVLVRLDSLGEEHLNYIKEYGKHKELPQALMQYEYWRIKYFGAELLATFPFLNRLNNFIPDNIPDTYYEKLDAYPLNKPAALGIPSYFEFIDYYIYQDIDSSILSKSGRERSFAFNEFKLQNVPKSLDSSICNYYQNYVFSSYAAFLKNKASLDSIASNYTIDPMATAYGTSKFDQLKSTNFYTLNEEVDLSDLVDISDNTFKSSTDYNIKLIYLNIWSSGCKPCIKNIPAHNKLVQEYTNRGVRFVNISSSQSKEFLKEYLNKNGFAGEHYLVTDREAYTELRNKLAFRGFPQYILLDADQRLLENHSRNAKSVSSVFDKYLKE